jgi:hypothetical protein
MDLFSESTSSGFFQGREESADYGTDNGKEIFSKVFMIFIQARSDNHNKQGNHEYLIRA